MRRPPGLANVTAVDEDDGSDPAVARVRRALAHLGSDEASAPDVPATVTARVGAALQAASAASDTHDGPTHSIPRPPLSRGRVACLLVGLGAALAGVLVGTAMLTREPRPPTHLDHGPTAESITVSLPADVLPLSDPDVVALLSRVPDYGPLDDARRRGSCLDGLGYPLATPVLGAAPVDMHGRPAVLLLLGGTTADEVEALVVEPNCNAAHTGLLAKKSVTRP